MTYRMSLHAARALGAACLLVAGLAAPPHAEAAQEPRAFVAQLGNQAIQVMQRSVPPQQRDATFRRLFDSDFDLPGIARFVLGPYGRRLTPPQQQQFLALFRDVLVQGYSERLAKYRGEPFRVTGARSSGAEAVVTSQVSPKDGKPVELDWHLAERDGRYLITDVAIDGVSMKLAQRETFAGIIQRNGGRADSLIAVLRQQLVRPSQG